MLAAKPILAAVLAAGVAYAAYPYVTLYRLDHALHTGDAATLQTLVDWPSVREGIKEDICDNTADAPTVSSGQLPAFGASFVRGIASSAVDQQVTPEGLVHMSRHDADEHGEGAAARVNWAFFSDPTDFLVSLHVPGQPGPIKLRMRLNGANWQVTHVSLPPHMLQEANART